MSNAAQDNINNNDDQGNILERLLFGYRKFFLLLFGLFTVVMGYYALQLRPEASFLRMIPTYHPYIQNYIAHQEDLKGLGNAIRIAVETTEGDIFDAEYLQTLQQINDDVFYISGVDRGGLKSLWTPVTRWTEVTEEGFAGGPVIPDTCQRTEVTGTRIESPTDPCLATPVESVSWGTVKTLYR